MNPKTLQVLISFLIITVAFFVWKLYQNNSGGQKYENAEYGFSINLPKEATSSEIDEYGADMVLIRDGTHQIQIYITPFDEDISLTIQRIKGDIPDLEMKDVIESKTDGTASVSFTSTYGDVEYREIWMVRQMNLYQIIAPLAEDEKTQDIIKSWKWDQ